MLLLQNPLWGAGRLKKMAEPQKRIVVILAGPPGSGKSTIREAAIAYRNFTPDNFVDTDELTKANFDAYNKENWKKAQTLANNIKAKKIANGQPLGFETILGSVKGIEFIKMVKEQNYIVDVFYVTTASPEKCIERVAQRATEGGHSQAPEDIRALYHLSGKNYIEAAKIADYTWFFDNSRDFEAATLLFKTDHGVVCYEDPAFPAWAIHYRDALSSGVKPAPPSIEPEMGF